MSQMRVSPWAHSADLPSGGMTNTLKKLLLTVAALAALALGGAALAGATSGGTPSGSDKATQEQSDPADSNSSEAADPADEQDKPGDKADEQGDKQGDHQDKGDKTLSGATAARAREAALAKTGGGKAGSVESETEKGATYGVEVTKPDGSKVDVFLDGQFNAIAVDSDQ
jgi:hypothetical protein